MYNDHSGQAMRKHVFGHMLTAKAQIRLDTTGPSCSKLTMSLVNDSLKFTLSDTHMLKFFADKMWVAFAVQKQLTFFSAKNIRILCIECAKTVNEMTLNELVKLTTLWKNWTQKNRQQRPGWYFTHAQDDLNPLILRMFEDTLLTEPPRLRR